MKRVRRDPAVTLAPCDRRGTPLGDAVRGTARLLDEAGTREVRALVRHKYGVAGRILPVLLPALSGVRRRDATPVALAITLDTR